jgi:hypothetical protein
MMPKQFACCTFFLFLATASQAWAGTSFTYQGQLKRGGVSLTDVCELTFKLFEAESGGTQLGPTVVATAVEIVNGLFTAEVDFGGGRFDGGPRWLEVSAACTGDPSPTTLTPRQPVTAAPHALSAETLDGFDSAAFLRSVPVPMALSGDHAGVAMIKATNTSTTAASTGVLGESTGTSGNTFGLWGTSNSSGGIGVLGQHKAITGTAAGVVGESSSNAGGAAGVYGKANGPAAVTYGVFGEAVSTAGRGVYGKSTAYGVYGEASGASGVGVQGIATLGDGVAGRTDAENKAGVFGLGSNANSHGVRGRHSSPAGVHAGVQGETVSASNGAKGVAGLATSATGATFGVYGESNSNAGQGVFGLATATLGATVGVQGESASGTAGAAGVIGYASNDVGQIYGVFGKCDSDAGFAVYGSHPGSGRALFGASTSGPGAYATTSTGPYAVYAERTAGGNRAWLGGASEGAWAESNNGPGLVAKTTHGTTAVFGERIANGNHGWLGGSGEGAMGEATSGNGVAGLSTDLNGNGGYFRNDGGGPALFADGLAKVRTLEIIEGGDLAEPFDVIGDEATKQRSDEAVDPSRDREGAGTVTPGMVVVIDADNPGKLKLARDAYDRKVAGVISGANGLSAGLIIKPGPGHAPGDHPVALTGRVWCWCDASFGSIEPGDMLTTSTTPGHAMKAADLAAAQGAVIGKAMTRLPEGRGLVLVLVSLQ